MLLRWLSQDFCFTNKQALCGDHNVSRWSCQIFVGKTYAYILYTLFLYQLKPWFLRPFLRNSPWQCRPSWQQTLNWAVSKTAASSWWAHAFQHCSGTRTSTSFSRLHACLKRWTFCDSSGWKGGNQKVLKLSKKSCMLKYAAKFETFECDPSQFNSESFKSSLRSWNSVRSVHFTWERSDTGEIFSFLNRTRMCSPAVQTAGIF